MRDDVADGTGILLVAIALPLLVAGMFGLNTRWMLIAAGIAVVGIIVRLARL
jgi:hypothetical protein